MSIEPGELKHPIRVVMFGSGPELNPDARQFLCRLEDHPEIEFLGAFCQAQSQSMRAVFHDLWVRRRWLAFPLFIAWLVNRGAGFLKHPHQAAELKRKLQVIADRIHFVPDIHAPEVLTHVSALKDDLGLIYGSPILRPALFEIPRLGTLGIHHGKVPE